MINDDKLYILDAVEAEMIAKALTAKCDAMEIELCDLRLRLDDMHMRYMQKCAECERAEAGLDPYDGGAMQEQDIADLNGKLAGAIEQYEREAMLNIKYKEALQNIVKHLEITNPKLVGFSASYRIAKEALNGV